MSAGDKIDWEKFNCSEPHEFTYVKELYTDPDAVYDWLKDACEEEKLNHSSHEEVYSMLEAAGFTKK